VMLYTLATREAQSISVIHDRNPLFVRLSDGAIRNGYMLRIINKRLEKREFILSISGLPGSLVDVTPPREDGRFIIEVGPDQTRELRVLVTDYAEPPGPSTPIRFHLIDTHTGERTATSDYFRGPGGE
jgi:polyferredoxin